jgi:hypothetical protein
MTAVDLFPRITRIEYELKILDCPPYLCASRCPAYNRKPCENCMMCDVLAVETEIVDFTGTEELNG